MTVKLLPEQHLDFLSLKGGYTGSPESIHVKMPYCWKSHVTAYSVLLYVQRFFQLCNVGLPSWKPVLLEVRTSRIFSSKTFSIAVSISIGPLRKFYLRTS